MKCEPRPIEGRPGFWHCPVCHYTNLRACEKPFNKSCDGSEIRVEVDLRSVDYMLPERLRANAEAVKLHGSTRTDTEIALIIANHCSWCEKWRPEAPKKKCASCSCGSTNTLEHLHRRRIKNCPKQNLPAAWTEEHLQRMMAHGSQDHS